MKNAKEIIETFWKIQDGGDYTKVVELFDEDAVLVKVVKIIDEINENAIVA